MLYIISHGQRADQGTLEDRMRVRNAWDPPLTSVGRMQSFLTGEQLYREIPSIKKKRLLVIVSPFRRCMETAENLLVGLQLTNITLYENCVFVDDAVRENHSDKPFTLADYYGLDFFKTKPMIFPDVKYNSLSVMGQFRDRSELADESAESAINRFRGIFKNICEFLLEKGNQDILPIIVTHGVCVNYMYEDYTTENNRRFIFCSVSKMTVDAYSKTLEMEYLDKSLY
jgi:broad specificity phosphatase PhoE